MNPLKYVLSFTFSVFFTIGLLANQNSISAIETNEQNAIEESPKVSAAEVVSLFNFFKVETIKPDEPNTSIKFSESKLKELYDFFMRSTNPVP